MFCGGAVLLAWSLYELGGARRSLEELRYTHPNICNTAEAQRNEGKQHKVRPARKVRELVEAERKGDGEEEELVRDCDEQRCGEVVVVDRV